MVLKHPALQSKILKRPTYILKVGSYSLRSISLIDMFHGVVAPTLNYMGATQSPACGLQRADSNVELVPTAGLHDLQWAPCDYLCHISDLEYLRERPSTSSHLHDMPTF